MERLLMNQQKDHEQAADKLQSDEISLFPGVELLFWTSGTTQASQTTAHAHIVPSPQNNRLSNQTIQINYCRSGQISLKTYDGDSIILSPGDFTIHSISAHASVPEICPTEQSSGLVITVDFKKASACESEILKEICRFDDSIKQRFCPDHAVAYFSENEQTQCIFAGFYTYPQNIRLPYLKIKTLELLLYLIGLEAATQKQSSECQSELTDIIKEIHDRLTGRMDERITIEELAKQYLINPTTLKAAFKAVYGTSIAAHIKEHRMEEAAKMLRDTHMSICEIARIVGYDSQSKFAVAFKGYFGVLPREYRKE